MLENKEKKEARLNELIRDHTFTVLINEGFDKCSNAYEIALYALLCKYASNSDRSSFPSTSTLAEKMNVHRNTITRTLKTLEEKEILKVIHRKSEKGHFTSSIYKLKY